MTDDTLPSHTDQNLVADEGVQLETGTYDIIRKRLLSQANLLRTRLDQLNQSRKSVFGSIDMSLLTTERIQTKNNCIPRDMIAIDNHRFIFGYNVHLGLKSEINLSDVLAVYEYKPDHTFYELPIESVLCSGSFESDFKGLYKYYKDAQFIQFSIIGPHLFMVFKIGKSSRDIKTFKWLIQDHIFEYIDNRSDHEFKLPAQHEFAWKRTNRDYHHYGEHPHVSIEDRVFVEAVGGDITFKVEDNTHSGQGIYSEPVEQIEQTLDDAEISYAIVGHMILVKIKPYMENNFRYYIYNEKIQEVCRIDAIENSCVLLPDDQGFIFSNGYYLQTGEFKQFESHLSNMMFERRASSANGEDFLYVFYQTESGDYIIMFYNMIEQTVATPIICNGYTIFDNGEMLYFRATEDPTRHHAIQIWQTPYVSDSIANEGQQDHFLYKIGNRDIVRCMAECHDLLKYIHKESVYSGIYIDLVNQCTTIEDAYFWLEKPEAFHIKEVIRDIKITSKKAVDEYEKVLRLQKAAQESYQALALKCETLLNQYAPQTLIKIDEYVNALGALRQCMGEIITVKEIRYIDISACETLEKKISHASESIGKACVAVLLKPDALTIYHQQIDQLTQSIDALSTVREADITEQTIRDSAKGLELLIDIIGTLSIEDATQTTQIIDNISEVYALFNQVKAQLKNQRTSLFSAEATAQFHAQLKLFNQSVTHLIDMCDTPEKCDESLTKMMVQIEELETRFMDFDTLIAPLIDKRNEIQQAFESKKLQLTEARQKKAVALSNTADRILKGIANRVSAMHDIHAINGFFASDLMIDKIRSIVTQLIDLNDTVKADDIQSRLKSIREDTVRQLKDKNELFTQDGKSIRFGDHLFSVNTQVLDLTIVQRDNKQFYHLSGTNYFDPLTDPEFLATAPVWDLSLISESPTVYRAEYLAFHYIQSLDAQHIDFKNLLKQANDVWEVNLREFMSTRYSEGYVRGVHDKDASKIAKALIQMISHMETLRFHPTVRAASQLFWRSLPENDCQMFLNKLKAYGVLIAPLKDNLDQISWFHALKERILSFIQQTGLFSIDIVHDAAQYIMLEMSQRDSFLISQDAEKISQDFLMHLKTQGLLSQYHASRNKIAHFPLDDYELVRVWLRNVMNIHSDHNVSVACDEAAMLLFDTTYSKDHIVSVSLSHTISGMIGSHPQIQKGNYQLLYYPFYEKLTHHETTVVPLFETCFQLKNRMTSAMRDSLRLEEFKPRILTSFVRNQLINKVYLPMIGDNLAKQIGVAGENKRTDRMGMLLLISPPGYGKTTLMEYIANRLGIIFMKINGPAIGNKVTSLDPAEAPNASAREEVEKLNLSLEMGDNVMIYLDDIQHCNPEFLQKFISLSDAQRKIEGVFRGKSKTYDLRGKKVAVVMAGNPYTESGEKFKIPDMLANRADTYNLGDIIGDNEAAFKLSYIENAVTSNSILNQLASKSQNDIYTIIHMAETNDRDNVNFDSAYSADAIEDMIRVMKKLFSVRDIIYKINQAYIYSAAQSEDYRIEPPFQLQGSYRNMNRIAEKVLPIMNDAELKTVLLSHYENESQTLATGAESNFLKFKEITGWLTDAENERWDSIKKMFRQNKRFRGADASDPVNRVVAELTAVQDSLDSIQEVLSLGKDVISKSMTQLNSKQHDTDWDVIKSLITEQMSALTKFTHQSDKNKKSSPTIQIEPVIEQMAACQDALITIKDVLEIGVNKLTTIEKPTKPTMPINYNSWFSQLPSDIVSKLEVVQHVPKNIIFQLIKKGDARTLKTILLLGEDANLTNSDGSTLLMAAAFQGNLDITELLISFGAWVNVQDSRGYTPLMIAAAKGHESVVSCLLNHGASSHLTDKNDLTALMWAEKHGHSHVMSYLK